MKATFLSGLLLICVMFSGALLPAFADTLVKEDFLKDFMERRELKIQQSHYALTSEAILGE